MSQNFSTLLFHNASGVIKLLFIDSVDNEFPLHTNAPIGQFRSMTLSDFKELSKAEKNQLNDHLSICLQEGSSVDTLLLSNRLFVCVSGRLDTLAKVLQFNLDLLNTLPPENTVISLFLPMGDLKTHIQEEVVKEIAENMYGNFNVFDIFRILGPKTSALILTLVASAIGSIVTMEPDILDKIDEVINPPPEQRLKEGEDFLDESDPNQ